jgi:Flp pilus assembly protein TadG
MEAVRSNRVGALRCLAAHRFLGWPLRSERRASGGGSTGAHHTIRSRTEAGAALVELAVALPLLAVILVGTIDFGQAFRLAMMTTNAARAGAQYGAQSLSTSADSAGMGAARDAVFAANGVTPGAAPAPVRWCECATDAGVFGGATACTAACPAGQHLVVSVSVTAVGTFSMINPFPGLPSGVTITRTASQRVPD